MHVRMWGAKKPVKAKGEWKGVLKGK
jgi:hypothetical protein